MTVGEGWPAHHFINANTIRLIAVIAGLSSCLIRAQDGEAKLMQANPDWQITSEAFTNPPYWLMPTNVPYTFYPLLNGKWVWTTNMQAPWFGSSIDTGVDHARAQGLKWQWQKEQREKWIESNPPGIANVLEYHSRWSTNMTENWWGIWAEDTNTGWRVNLWPVKTNAVDDRIIVKVGSIVTNSGAGLLLSPDGKYAKLELLDSNGKSVPTRKGAALNLYQIQFAVQKESQLQNYRPPPSSDATVTRDYPDTISDLEYPRWNEGVPKREKGKFIWFAGFTSNGPPCYTGHIKFNDIFSIKSEGDYTLTVQPVLYRMRYEGGTFQGFLDRVDLPSISTKVHLVPK